jgi:membrane protease YdiL (CAAX protease family)
MESRASWLSARTGKGADGMKTNYLKKYIISSYILVWALIIFVAGMASLVFHAPPVIMWIVRNLIAWSPTYLLLIGWKHFRPDETRRVFIKRCFSGKVKLFPLLCSFALTFGISVLALFLFSAVMGKPVLSYINFGIIALPLSIFLSFTSGPTGEELGWRGFMREEFNKRYGFLKSSVCQGLVWCFWHTLLWAVDSEFTDWRAVPYVISNIVVITCMTVLMNIFLEWHNNLIYSVLLHFGFNIIYVFLEADIGFFVILTVLYLVITPIVIFVRNKTAERLSKNDDSGERKIKE